MKIRILSVSFSMLLSYSGVWAATLETPDIGKNTFIDLQLFEFPIGTSPHSNVVSGKKEKGEAKYNGGKDKEMLDKKVDDAIKKALEEK